jgi:BON domain
MNDRSARVFAPARKERSTETPAAKEAQLFWSKAPSAKAPLADEVGAPGVRGASTPTDWLDLWPAGFASDWREKPRSGDPGDSDLLTHILNALYWDLAVPSDDLSLKLEKGWVTISGEVVYSYQKSSAEADVRRVSGVRGVTNEIEIKPTR